MVHFGHSPQFAARYRDFQVPENGKIRKSNNKRPHLEPFSHAWKRHGNAERTKHEQPAETGLSDTANFTNSSC